MTLDSVPELARRILHLEMELKRVKPSAGTDNAALLKRMSALEGVVARFSKATPTKPQVYTPKPAVRVPKPTDNSLALKLAALEREVERLPVWERPAGGGGGGATDVTDHGELDGLSDNDHPQYLLAATGKAADSDKLDGLDSTAFAKVITLTAGDGLTGGGDLSADRTFDVLAGLGIDFDVNGAVIVDLTENYAWTGNHSFTKTMYAGSIMPHVSDLYDLGDSAHLWRKIFASELSAVVFAQYEQTLLGGWFTVSKGEGVLPADILSTDTTIDLGADTFKVGDIIVFRGISATNTPQVEYIKIASDLSGTLYGVTRNLDGTGANNWQTGTVFANYGRLGDGRIELNAYDSPRLSVFSHANTIAGFREQVRIGDLINGWGYSASTYGGAFGSYESGKANITIDPTNGIRIRNYDQTVIQLTGTEASFENVIKLGTSGRLQQGTGVWGTNFTGSAIWNESGVMNIGGWKNNVKQWWGGSDGKLYAGGGDVILDQEGIKLYNDDTYSGAGRIDFYDAYDNPIGALYGWGETATPLTLHEIMLNVSDDRPVGTDTTTSIIMLSESYNNARIKLQAAVPAIYKDNVNATILLSKDDTGNNIRMYGDVTLGDHTVNSDLVVNGTIKDGSGIAYLKSTGKAADSDKLDGLDSTAFATASHDHDGTYIPLTNFAGSSPTVTASSGTFTTVSCFARTITIGKMRIYSGLVYITNAGTATGTLRVPIPTGTPASMGGGMWVGSGFVDPNKSCIVTLFPTKTYLEILRYDGATAIASGVSVAFSITYEIS